MKEFAAKVQNAEHGKTHLFSLGQAGFIIKSSSGQLLGIDMYLSNCVERVEGHAGYKRLLPQIMQPKELEFDVIIATHRHKDHFDYDAIPTLLDNKKTILFASALCEKDVVKLGIINRNIHYVSPGEKHTYKDFSIDFINCDHGSTAPDAVGIIISVDGKTIIETGDTCLRLDRAAEYLQKGTPDVLIAPINGMYGNLNSEDCATLSDALKPKLTIPCHYGMFASHMGSVGEFYNIMTNKHPDNHILLMAQGEQYTL